MAGGPAASSFNDLTVERKLELYRNIVGECWRYTRGHNKDGYGVIHYKGKDSLVHRVAAVLWLEFDIDSKGYICHKEICKHKDCFNPEHLYIGTALSNMEDRKRAGGYEKLNTDSCLKCGKDYDSVNTFYWRGKRLCRNCRKLAQRRYLQNKTK